MSGDNKETKVRKTGDVWTEGRWIVRQLADRRIYGIPTKFTSDPGGEDTRPAASASPCE